MAIAAAINKPMHRTPSPGDADDAETINRIPVIVHNRIARIGDGVFLERVEEELARENFQTRNAITAIAPSVVTNQTSIRSGSFSPMGTTALGAMGAGAPPKAVGDPVSEKFWTLGGIAGASATVGALAVILIGAWLVLTAGRGFDNAKRAGVSSVHSLSRVCFADS